MLRLVAVISFAIMLLTNLTGYTKFSGWVVASPIIAYILLYFVLIVIQSVIEVYGRK